MSQLPQQIPPHPLVTNKQITIIRKTAAESLKPIIQKYSMKHNLRIQEHIQYLLLETKLLREKNEVLDATVADHKVVHERVDEFNTNLDNFLREFNEYKFKYEKDKKSNTVEFTDINDAIEKINRNLRAKEQKITQLFEKNGATNDKFQQIKKQFGQFCENIHEEVVSLQSQNREVKSSIRLYRENTENSINSILGKFEDRQQKYKQVDQKLGLYLDQRQQLRNMISQSLSKLQQTIDVQRYEHDWKIIRLQNKNMRQDNQKMIDQALTPEVRSFLPQIISRMQQLRKVDKLELDFLQQKQKTNHILQLHNKQLAEIQITINQNYTELQTFKQLSQQKLAIQDQKLTEKIQTQIQQTQKIIQQLQSSLENKLSQSEANLSIKIDHLIDRSRQQIYQLVIDQIPIEEKQFYNKMKDFLPLLESTKQEIMCRCDDITEFGKGLQAQLENFNNQITKVKSNITVQFDSIKKKNIFIEKNINQINQKYLKDIGKILSVYCQTLLVCLSCQIQSSGGPIGDTFVTYNDGIIYEKSQNKNQESSETNDKSCNFDISYRKTKTTVNLLTKATLQILIKLTDKLICGDQLKFLQINNNKPSQHFRQIKQQSLHFVNAFNINKSGSASKRYRENSSNKKRKQSTQNKLPSLDANKTIDVSTMGIDSYRQHFSQTLTNDFIAPTKKVERVYKGRYSQMK